MLACVNNKMKVRQKNDYKSIALPAELQGLELINRIFSLISQLNQSKKDPLLARCCCSSQLPVAQSRAFVTDKSVFKSVFESWEIWDFKSSFNFITNKQWSGKNEKSKSNKNQYRKIRTSNR